MGKIYTVIFLMLLLIVSSCSSYDQIVNYNESASFPLEAHVITNYEPIQLQPGDLITVNVSSVNAEAVAAFREGDSGFMLDKEGSINFPLAGKVNLRGKNLLEAQIILLKSIKQYFDIQPTLNLALANFKIIVNGEVNSPGVINVQNDRITIIEAMTLSGDFTAYSKRDSVMIVRENALENKRSFGYVNFNSSEIFESPYFYLKQNDVIYVKPDKRFLATINTRQQKILPYVGIAISLALLTVNISRSR